MMTQAYQWRSVTPQIMQIVDDRGVCCTLVQGRTLAILMDTGFGVRDIRAFVERQVRTPYMVINSHAHPDHVGGNYRFDCAYGLREELPLIRMFMEREECELRALDVGQVIDLGGLTAEVISLAGHTSGHLGLLIREERLLLSGDALSENVWLFGPGSLTLPDLRRTILRVLPLPFGHYLCGHAVEMTPKSKLLAHLRHIDQLDVTRTTRGFYRGSNTLKSVFADELGRSVLVFDADRPANWEKKPAPVFRLGIIEESLSSRDVLEEAAPFFAAQRTQQVPGDEYPLWHVDEFRLPEQELLALLDHLAAGVKPTWYIHAFDESTLYVVLTGRWFRLNVRRDASWDAMIDYGVRQARVERHYLENIPLHI